MSNKLRRPPKSLSAMKAQMKVKNVRATNPMSRPYARPVETAGPRPKAEGDYDWGRTAIEPKKGEKDGNCNRTACQAPLKGREQWYMDNYSGGRLYYCGKCARDFNDSDRKFGEPRRCTFDDETVLDKLAS